MINQKLKWEHGLSHSKAYFFSFSVTCDWSEILSQYVEVVQNHILFSLRKFTKYLCKSQEGNWKFIFWDSAIRNQKLLSFSTKKRCAGDVTVLSASLIRRILNLREAVSSDTENPSALFVLYVHLHKCLGTMLRYFRGTPFKPTLLSLPGGQSSHECNLPAPLSCAWMCCCFELLSQRSAVARFSGLERYADGYV